MMLLGFFVMFIMFFMELLEVDINAFHKLGGFGFLELDGLNIADGQVSEKDANN